MPSRIQFSYPRRSLRDFLFVLFRHKWKVLIVFFAVAFTVTLVTFILPEIFLAEAKLLVRVGRESVTLDPTATTGRVISMEQSRQNEIKSELEILNSRELALRVVDAIGPEKFLKGPNGEDLSNQSPANKTPSWKREIQGKATLIFDEVKSLLKNMGLMTSLDSREEAVIEFMENLKIEGTPLGEGLGSTISISQKNNNTISLTYEGKNPKFAETVLSKLIDFYLDKHITAYRTPGSYDFFDRQSKDLRDQLVKTEEELKALKNQTGVASLDEQRKIILSRIGSLQQEVEANEAALAVSRAKVAELKNKLAGVSPTLVTQEMKSNSTQGVELMRSKLFELKLKEQELFSKYTPTSPPVQEIRRQIAEAQAQLDKEEKSRIDVTTGINTTHQQLNLNLLSEMAILSSLEAKALIVNRQLALARSKVQEINDTEMRMVSLQRERALQDANYRKYSENREQARIDQALEMNKISNISVIQKATASMNPIKPRKLLNVGLGVVVGLLVSLMLAFSSEYLDHSIKTPEDIKEKLQINALASIPYLKHPQGALGATNSRSPKIS